MFLPACASLLCLGVCLPLFLHYKTPQPVLGALFKSLGTACAFVIALVAALKLEPLCWICVVALALHVVADYLLEFHFPLGMGAFMAGHLAYIAFFFQRFSWSTACWICVAGFLLMMAFILWQWRQRAGGQIKLFALYGAVLCTMVGMAVGGGLSCFTLSGALVAAGGALFYLSDAVLLRRLLFPTGPDFSLLIMITYYAAQLLFGCSCLF